MRVKAGLQEAYDYVGDVNEDISRLNEELHPPENRKLRVQWNTFSTRSLVPGRSNRIASWSVWNEGNVPLIIASMAFTIQGISSSWIKTVSVENMGVITSTNGLYLSRFSKRIEPGKSVNLVIQAVLKEEFKNEPAFENTRVWAVLEGIDMDGEVVTPLPMKGDEIQVALES